MTLFFAVYLLAEFFSYNLMVAWQDRVQRTENQSASTELSMEFI
jgi:hypothetical protein